MPKASYWSVLCSDTKAKTRCKKPPLRHTHCRTHLASALQREFHRHVLKMKTVRFSAITRTANDTDPPAPLLGFLFGRAGCSRRIIWSNIDDHNMQVHMTTYSGVIEAIWSSVLLVHLYPWSLLLWLVRPPLLFRWCNSESVCLFVRFLLKLCAGVEHCWAFVVVLVAIGMLVYVLNYWPLSRLEFPNGLLYISYLLCVPEIPLIIFHD